MRDRKDGVLDYVVDGTRRGEREEREREEESRPDQQGCDAKCDVCAKSGKVKGRSCLIVEKGRQEEPKSGERPFLT